MQKIKLFQSIIVSYEFYSQRSDWNLDIPTLVVAFSFEVDYQYRKKEYANTPILSVWIWLYQCIALIFWDKRISPLFNVEVL